MLRLVLADGPHAGARIATVEQVQLADCELNPTGTGALARGRIVASWGLDIDADFELPASLVLTLGINRGFRTLPRARRAAMRRGADGAYLADGDGAILSARPRLCHVHADHAVYAL